MVSYLAGGESQRQFPAQHLMLNPFIPESFCCHRHLSVQLQWLASLAQTRANCAFLLAFFCKKFWGGINEPNRFAEAMK